MKGVKLRSMNVSKPVLGLLLVAAGLAAFAYWRDHREDRDPPVVASATSASSSGAGANAAAAASAASVTQQDPASAASSSYAGAAPTAAAPAAPGSPAPAAAVVDLFPSQNWLPPPPPPPPVSAVPPPPPEPPPLPFVVRSLWLDQRGVLYVVLNAAGKDFLLCAKCDNKGFLRTGDVLLNDYRIESVNERDVGLLYMPLKRRQQLSFGGKR
jgi:hypothetical protein